MPFVLGDNGPVRGERGRGGSRREDWPVIESSGEGEGSNHRPFKRCSSWAANNINRATSQSHNGPLWRRPVARARSLSRVNARNINRERRRALLSSRDEYYHPLRHPGFSPPPFVFFLSSSRRSPISVPLKRQYHFGTTTALPLLSRISFTIYLKK